MGKRVLERFRRDRDETVAAARSGDTTRSKIENRGIWKRFFHTCKVARIPYLLLAVYILLNVGESQLLVRIPQINANFFAGDASVNSIAMFIGAELMSTVVVQIVLYVNQMFRAKTNRNLRNVLWGKILRLKPKYYDRVSANTLLSRITIDTDSLNAFIMDVVLQIFFQIYMLYLTIREMSSISLKASFLLLAFVPLSILISFIMGRLNLKFQNAMKFKMSDLTGYLSELVSSLTVVKAFNRQRYESRRGKKVINEYYTAQRNTIFLDIGQQIVSSLFGVLPEIVIILMGIRMLKNSTLTPAGWYTFYLYAGTLLTFVSGLGSLFEQTKSIQGQLNKVSDVLFEEEEGLESYVKEAVESGDIVFDNVSFSYGDTQALNGVSFTIPENKITALVGYSGSGKSTVLKLLERVYDPNEGRILLRGSELKDYDLKAWRSKIAFVTQSAPMISGTIRENILYGIKREISDEEIMEAAKLVYVDKFIESCPDGLEHQVGQFGSKLSGGQRQKISIARAILTQAEYLILDEPTASLDIISAEEVAQAIENLRGKATIIMIAHQPRVIRSADHIIVLDKEHSAVEGVDSDLRLTNEFYAQLTQGEGGEAK